MRNHFPCCEQTSLIFLSLPGIQDYLPASLVLPCRPGAEQLRAGAHPTTAALPQQSRGLGLCRASQDTAGAGSTREPLSLPFAQLASSRSSSGTVQSSSGCQPLALLPPLPFVWRGRATGGISPTLFDLWSRSQKLKQLEALTCGAPVPCWYSTSSCSTVRAAPVRRGHGTPSRPYANCPAPPELPRAGETRPRGTGLGPLLLPGSRPRTGAARPRCCTAQHLPQQGRGRDLPASSRENWKRKQSPGTAGGQGAADTRREIQPAPAAFRFPPRQIELRRSRTDSPSAGII